MKRRVQRSVLTDGNESDVKPKRDWYDKGHLTIAGVSLLIAGAVAGLTILDRLNEPSIVERAWIAPLRIQLVSEPQKDAQFQVMVTYQNTGKVPALKLGASGNFLTIPIVDNLKYVGNAHAYCRDAENSKDSLTIFPVTGSTYEQTFNIFAQNPSDNIQNGKLAAYFQGCFVYDTLGKLHESEFCFYWLYDPNKPMTEWQTRFCPASNDTS
jgi:hypothetical protein